jgi:hypothetical protein
MKRLTLLTGVVALTAIVQLATSGASFAAYRWPGGCTPPAGQAVGWQGPAMNGGQLMAGVGQCRRIADGYYARGYYWGRGYPGRGWGAFGYAPGYW